MSARPLSVRIILLTSALLLSIASAPTVTAARSGSMIEQVYNAEGAIFGLRSHAGAHDPHTPAG